MTYAVYEIQILVPINCYLNKVAPTYLHIVRGCF